MTEPMIPPAHRLRFYGLTEEQFVQLWEAQKGSCYICHRRFTRGRPAHIDHNHLTGEVRGLLCGADNQAIGWLHEDIDWLRDAADYLSVPPALLLWGKATPRVKGAPPADLLQSPDPSHGE